jgi:hypothetical protein
MAIATLLVVFGVIVMFAVKACTKPEGMSWLGTTAGPSTRTHTPPWFGDA